MRCRTTCLAAAPALLAGALHAVPADGVYDGYDCTAAVSDQRITLQGDQIGYYESRCRLTAPEPVAGMADATLLWAECSGEGEVWRERILLMTRMGGDLIVVGDGWAERYARCAD